MTEVLQDLGFDPEKVDHFAGEYPVGRTNPALHLGYGFADVLVEKVLELFVG